MMTEFCDVPSAAPAFASRQRASESPPNPPLNPMLPRRRKLRRETPSQKARWGRPRIVNSYSFLPTTSNTASRTRITPLQAVAQEPNRTPTPFAADGFKAARQSACRCRGPGPGGLRRSALDRSARRAGGTSWPARRCSGSADRAGLRRASCLCRSPGPISSRRPPSRSKKRWTSGRGRRSG